jgi:hypothetical protein
MKDTFNIVKVSDYDDVDCDKIIKKCYEKPNLINYYYPHIFMNRDKIDKEELMKTFDKYVMNVKRDKNIEQTIRKYNVLTNILESLFLCVFDMNTIKNIQKFIQFSFSKDNNNIIDIVNHIIQEHNLYNLEMLLNDKIDNSSSVLVVEKMIDHIKKTYTNSCLEIQTLQQFQIISNIHNYIMKQKFNPFINKVFNFNKKELIKEYINKCEINSDHDTYISNIITNYEDIKTNVYDLVDDCDWNVYFKKISDSLNITDIKEKTLKTIFRLNILNKILTINSKDKITEENKNIKNNIKNDLLQSLQSIIDTNKIDKIIVNSYINMLKNNTQFEKLVPLENVIKYFSNYSLLSKELIKLILPKFFSKDNVKYYFDAVNRLNNVTNKKLSLIDNIVEQQKRFADDLKITSIENESKSIFDKELVSIYNVDHKYIDNTNLTGKITNYLPEIKAYNVFTKKWFERNYSGMKEISINDYFSNGKLQIDNTVITSNLIMINALYLFNNTESSTTISKIKENFSEDLVNDIINSLEYYNIAQVSGDNIKLNISFMSNKQDIKVELIKKKEIVQEETKDTKQEISDPTFMIECQIIKTIKPAKIHQDSIYDIVSMKIGKQIEKDLFEKCMKRLHDIDYFVIENDHLVYVP